MKILLTAFDPFGQETVNPALEAIKNVSSTINGAEIIKLEVPTVFSKAAELIFDKIEEINPDMILSIGQAGNSTSVDVEFVAINYAYAKLADNDGNMPTGEKLYPDGPDAFFSTLPVESMVDNIKSKGIPSNVSFTAGTFVCNDIMYRTLYYLDKHNKNIKSGFIHVPFSTGQVVNKPSGTASMNLDDISRAIEFAIEAMLDNK
ncbi:MAG: pyroglutamyl-peptidase I [Tissierellia bacterium]|nr:pyroglutamyl-peptidase I [Tissierellia bacterium]